MVRNAMHKIDLEEDMIASPYVLGLRGELASGSMKGLSKFQLADLEVELCRGSDSLWVIIRRHGDGGLALRTAYIPAGEFKCRAVSHRKDEPLRFEVDSGLGIHTVTVAAGQAELNRLCVSTRFRPATTLRLPFLPRDLYALDAEDDPLGAVGNVEAAQRGVNSGLVYFRFAKPNFGSVLYFQDLTRLNPGRSNCRTPAIATGRGGRSARSRISKARPRQQYDTMAIAM